ncbi:2OG-Fe dioxygenase family protein [Limnohabitans sp.]|uniref:2OG-Fe dioxygenase family protein n=1 Tax=Limnohabitans sp. TaxID=1907725 RepID=UPI00286F8106|nr:2OG-Fe dioxygenase family protein [Limnohabitans sp.]
MNNLLHQRGFCILDAASVANWIGSSPNELCSLASDWENMPIDLHLKDGGRYRRRRHSSFIFENSKLVQAQHRAHWQPLDYNALHGGMERWFEPVLEQTVCKSAWIKILSFLAKTSNQMYGKDMKWCIEAHQFRIDTTDGIGRPTPEGAHRDGVDFVAVFMINRVNIKGGETRVFDAQSPHGERFTLTQPWSLLLLDDARVIHESTPIQPLGSSGYRDTLVVTLRANNFQDAIA